MTALDVTEAGSFLFLREGGRPNDEDAKAAMNWAKGIIN
jgi:hypothetical protein